MPSTSVIVVVVAAFVMMGGAVPSHAADAQAASEPANEPRTLKERLGDKASDDQRVDNCKVPVAERGSKARPDDCSHSRDTLN
jgi:hypothetical protein